MRLMRLHPSWFLAFWLALASGVAHAAGENAPDLAPVAPRDIEAEQLLKRMAQAMQTTNYEGLLLHMRGGEARSMRIFHRYDAELGEREHLLSLDGKPFEIVQDAKGCTCVWPQSRLVVVGSHPSFKGRLSAERFAQTDALSEFYAINRQGYARVGGIACRLVQLRPRDDFRFGYRLCIHEPSGLLLNLEVFDGERRLENNQFTQLRVRPADEGDDMRLFSNVEGFRVVEDKAGMVEANKPTPAQWTATRVPPGYELRSSSLRMSPHNAKPLEQWIFSDGLGSVSIFIERIEAEEGGKGEALKPKPNGVMQRMVREMNGYRLTAVGDAPEAAMRSMLEGMQPASTAAPKP